MDITQNLKSISFADLLAQACKEEGICLIGDDSHSSIDLQLAMYAPEVVSAAKSHQKTAFIVEGYSTSKFEETFKQFAEDKITEAQLYEFFEKVKPNNLNPQHWEEWRRGQIDFWKRAKEEGVAILGTDRQAFIQKQFEVMQHPEFFEMLLQAQKAAGEGREDDFNAKLRREKGQDWINEYNRWFTESYNPMLNRIDGTLIEETIKRHGNSNVVVVWGNAHNQELDVFEDVDGYLGKNNKVTVISSYENVRDPQLTTLDGSRRVDPPDYVYYHNEGQSLGGKVNPKLDLRYYPGYVALADEIKLCGESIKQNSLAGCTVSEGITPTPVPFSNLPQRHGR